MDCAVQKAPSARVFTSPPSPINDDHVVYDNPKHVAKIKQVFKDFMESLEPTLNESIIYYQTNYPNHNILDELDFRREVTTYMEWYFKYMFPIYVKNERNYYKKKSSISADLLIAFNSYINPTVDIMDVVNQNVGGSNGSGGNGDNGSNGTVV